MARTKATTRAKPTAVAHAAVVIGTNYQDSRVPSLRSSEADANAMAEALTAAEYNVILLLGPDATRRRILDSIARQCAAVDADGLVLIYYSGHGALDPQNPTVPLLIPHDVDPQALAPTSISLQDLAQHYLYEEKSVVALLDTCHSGYLPVDNAFPTGRTFVIMAATARNQVSYEVLFEGEYHGIFSYHVLDHWRRSPEAVDVNSLYRSVARAMVLMDRPPPVLSGVQTGLTILRPALPASPPAPALPGTTLATFVIDDSKVAGRAKRDLVELLATLFPARAELEKLTDYYLSRPLDRIPLEGTDLDSLLLSVVNWCLTQGGNMVGAFLSGAIEERPLRDDLRTMVQQLAKG